MSKPNENEEVRHANHPRRSLDQSRRLCDMGCYPFPELDEEQNDAIYQARLAGFAVFFAAFPDAAAQAHKTHSAALRFLMDRAAAQTQD